MEIVGPGTDANYYAGQSKFCPVKNPVFTARGCHFKKVIALGRRIGKCKKRQFAVHCLGLKQMPVVVEKIFALKLGNKFPHFINISYI